MMTLESMISVDMIFLILAALTLLIGLPAFTTLLMKLYLKVATKKENAKNVKNYTKEFTPFLSIIIFSTIVLVFLLFMLKILFENAYPFY